MKKVAEGFFSWSQNGLDIKDERALFRLINQGSESLGIMDKNVLDVPAYNGGLFDPQKNPELEKWAIGDTFLSEAIDLLSRSKADGGKPDFVDYSTLEIRHLGSIYEGLLEYKLRVAEDEMVVNGGEWVKLEEYNKDRKQKKVFSDFNEFDMVKKGQIYLATDKGERKATGSYYTPDYIVNYIVKNTVGPVVDEKWKEAQANKKRMEYMDILYLSLGLLFHLPVHYDSSSWKIIVLKKFPGFQNWFLRMST